MTPPQQAPAPTPPPPPLLPLLQMQPQQQLQVQLGMRELPEWQPAGRQLPELPRPPPDTPPVHPQPAHMGPLPPPPGVEGQVQGRHVQLEQQPGVQLPELPFEWQLAGRQLPELPRPPPGTPPVHPQPAHMGPLPPPPGVEGQVQGRHVQLEQQPGVQLPELPFEWQLAGRQLPELPRPPPGTPPMHPQPAPMGPLPPPPGVEGQVQGRHVQLEQQPGVQLPELPFEWQLAGRQLPELPRPPPGTPPVHPQPAPMGPLPPPPAPPVLLALQETQAPASPPLRPDQPRPMAMQQPDVGRGAARGAATGAGWVMQLPDPPSSALPPPPPLQAQRGGLLPPPPGVAPAPAEEPDARRELPEGQPTGLHGQRTHSSRGRQPPLPLSLLSMPPLPLQPAEASHRRSAAERTTTGASSTTPTTRGVRSSPRTTPRPPSTPTRRTQPPPTPRAPTQLQSRTTRGDRGDAHDRSDGDRHRRIGIGIDIGTTRDASDLDEAPDSTPTPGLRGRRRHVGTWRHGAVRTRLRAEWRWQARTAGTPTCSARRLLDPQQGRHAAPPPLG